MSINLLSYGAVGDGVTDNTAAIQAAVNDAYLNKTYLYVPAGDYLTDTITMPFAVGSVYNQGNYIEGDGMLNSKFKAKSVNTQVLNYSQPVPYKYQLGGSVSGLTIDGNGLAGTAGISAQALYSYRFEDLLVTNCTNNIKLLSINSPGDGDACNHIIIDNCRIWNASSWGILNQNAVGNNETSFLTINNTTIQNCGTVSGAIGGGMYWRGQMLEFNNSAFVENKNRGFYIEGGAGRGSEVLGNNLCFENNGGMNIQCYGISGMILNNLQMYNGDANPATYGIWLNAQTLISNVRVNSAKIRTSAANTPFIAFAATGANLSATTVVVDSKQVRWDYWGFPGQTQYSGWTVV